MPLKTTSSNTAPVHRTPNDYTPDWDRAPQYVKNMRERLNDAGYNPSRTYGGSRDWNRYQDDYQTVSSWANKNRGDQYWNDYAIKRHR